MCGINSLPGKFKIIWWIFPDCNLAALILPFFKSISVCFSILPEIAYLYILIVFIAFCLKQQSDSVPHE